LAASGGLCAVIALIYFKCLGCLHPVGGQRLVLWPLVALGIWASEAYPVKVRNRKMSLSIGLSEIPVLVGIVFLSPLTALGAACCGHSAASLQRRRDPVKIPLNCAVYLTAMSAGILVYDRWLGKASPVAVRGWVVSAGTVAVIAMANLVLVLGLMALADRRWKRPPVAAISIQAGLYIGVCTAGGLVAVSLVWVNTWGIALFVAIALGTTVAYRTTIVSRQRYSSLEKLYDFTRRLSSLSEGREVMVTVLEEARTLLSGGRAELVVPLEAPMEDLVLRCSLYGEASPRFEEGQPLSSLDVLVGERGPLLLGPHSDHAAVRAMSERGLSEALVAPLQREDPRSGYLLVADRPFRHEGFKNSDLRFFETLAANAGVALRSSDLLERLRREVAVRQYQAHHDSLTGLPNRALFGERLAGALRTGPSVQVAVMFVDLNGFKEVNDTLGHDTGDAILREVATRLKPFSGPNSVVARLGGDEFAILSAGASDELEVEVMADEVVSAISKPFAIEGLLLDVRASVGVAIAPERGRGRSPGNIMRHADIAMYLAKEAGGGVRFYKLAEDRSTLRRLTLATELRQAIEHEALDVWYQPVVHLATGAVLGCEALVRWSHEQFGPIAPVEFIPVAESAGLIDPLTWWVLDEALAQLKSWREFAPDLVVAVNLSARSLAGSEVPQKVDGSLRRAGIEPAALTLELTESTMMADPVASQRAMNNLEDIGVNLSIDDYGTGFSSLSRLKDLPFKELKIDRSFVKEMTRDRGDEAIVRSTIELARSLGRHVTAEGVEDKATLDRLTSLGCHAAQGYYLARPLPPRECGAWLTAFTLDGVERISDIGAARLAQRRALARPASKALNSVG
jgi:diguanylate cyclase (GGDEF)-like protein